MKKLTAIILVAIMACVMAACGAPKEAAPTGTDSSPAGKETTTAGKDTSASATVGGEEFVFDQKGEFYGLAYKYPGKMELEKEDEEGHPRDIIRYRNDNYESSAFGVIVSRTKGSTGEKRAGELLKDSNAVSQEEINGITWYTGTYTNSSGATAHIYGCTKDEYAYTISVSTDYSDDFDLSGFAKVFVENVTMG